MINNKRYTDIFKKLVEVYVETGQPVGSRTLSKILDNPLSPATIRNVMSDLEDLGILCSDHISSGRKPTEKGWRFFVDGLIESCNITEIEKQALSKIKENAMGQSIESILENASEILSKLSNCVSLVVTPTFNQTIKHIEFVLLNPGRAIVVIVNDCGLVENRLIQIPNEISATTLEQATRYINTRFSGLTLEEIRNEVQQDVEYRRDDINKIAEQLISKDLGFVAPEENDKVIIKGQSNLIDKSNEIDSLKELLNKFDEQQTIKNILDQSILGQGVQIFIGAETKMFEMSGCSIIASSYHDSKKNIIGALGIIGPSRLRYSRIIPLVDYTAKLLGSIIG
ncbi:MAG: heat-inducible transcription repressor HrcA [Alphaproteobacteria bacterium]|nr:heat-inducible transcription repressor HrcA [Alphaproteobacteria bacterium]